MVGSSVTSSILPRIMVIAGLPEPLPDLLLTGEDRTFTGLLLLLLLSGSSFLPYLPDPGLFLETPSAALDFLTTGLVYLVGTSFVGGVSLISEELVLVVDWYTYVLGVVLLGVTLPGVVLLLLLVSLLGGGGAERVGVMCCLVSTSVKLNPDFSSAKGEVTEVMAVFRRLGEGELALSKLPVDAE